MTLLAARFARADVSLRELQARADRAGGTRLPRSSCADMLAGRRFPKKAMMVAFLRACRVPEHELPAWERAWERVRLTRMPAVPGQPRTAGPGPAGRPADGEPNRPATLVSAVGGRWRCAVLLVPAVAGIAVVVVAAAMTLVSLGRTTTDDGRAFGPGGSSRFTVRIDPANTGVRLVRRLDANVPLQRASVAVDGVPVGEWRPLLGGTYGWVDQTVMIPPELTSGRSRLTVVNTFVSSAWDFNEFRYLVQQRINDGWTTADVLDIGPGHTGSEAAHGYRITNQTFRGSRTLEYPPPGEQAGEHTGEHTGSPNPWPDR
ncbi:hypothetical protein [Spongiactinospora sp. TRM90649]|uniref:hypothetical protein n=1 Tax=Spongiactinospora sp. TRM90649 TaxID=3031114 RepID=UPI0023FA1202|nr:hypothetical protein [Spongiactinospora sp. TRM90649]MDF5754130.1 hypothetical protein [Spongiactinospora sp. TRM90649]